MEVDDTLVVDQAEAWIQDVRRGKLVASQVAARSVLPTRRAAGRHGGFSSRGGSSVERRSSGSIKGRSKAMGPESDHESKTHGCVVRRGSSKEQPTRPFERRASSRRLARILQRLIPIVCGA